MELYCKRNLDEIGELGEPLAYLNFIFPVDVSKQDVKTLVFSNVENDTVITVEPSNGRLLVNDGLTIKAYDVHCEGAWPRYTDATFRFHIHGEAIPYLCGKEVDVAVWVDSEHNPILTGCEAIGIQTQFEENNLSSHTYDKPLRRDTSNHIKISDNSIEMINDWFERSLESYYQDNSDIKPIVRMYACEEYIMFQMVQKNECGKMTSVGPQAYFPLDIYALDVFEIEMYFVAPVLDLCMREDFNGWLDIDLDNKTITALGEYRQSVIQSITY